MKQMPYEFNRKTYLGIKKMDRSQMANFLKDLYMQGYESGREDAEGLNGNEIREVILGIKGIGEKKADMILEAIMKKADEKLVEKQAKR